LIKPNSVTISIITPTFNSATTLRETLESVAIQDYSDVEHLVVDGGSTDGTLEILQQFDRVDWISEPDEGHYHAMNKGIAKATGDVIGVLNSDDCYTPGTLAAVADAFHQHPEWDALIGDVIYVDGTGNEIFRRQEARWDPQVIRLGFAPNHQTLFVRRSTFERLGTFRHRDFKNTCDYEFFMRLARSGCTVGTLRRYVVRYRFHDFGQSADRRVASNMKRECEAIRREYGVPGGLVGKALEFYARGKRQLEKLFILGKVDLIPGKVHLRRHMRERTTFSSNIGVNDLGDG
jgi:glycosyltransferase involved in cell wall biosynthesis